MRREGWCALLFLGLGTLVILERVAVSFYDFGPASAELPAAVEAYRASGLPWTAADIDPHVRPDENAAPALRAAFDALPSDEEIGALRDRAWYGEPIGDLTPFAPALAIAHRAAAKPKLDFARNWDLGPNLLFPEEAKVKALSQLLAIRAETRAGKGDDSGALADLEDARRLAKLIGSEPIVLSPLVGNACETRALVAVRKCLAAAHDDPARLARYRAWIAAAPPPPDLVRALRGEIYNVVAGARNFDRMGIGRGLWPPSDLAPFVDAGTDEAKGRHDTLTTPPVRRNGFPQNTRSRAYMARCLQMWTEVAEATHGFTDSIDVIGKTGQIVSERHDSERGMSHYFDAILFPVFSQFGRTNRTLATNRNLTFALADALILHAETGRWPQISTLRDSLGHGPLHTRADGKRFRVWSVGPNGKDEGGLLPREAKMGSNTDDLLVTYPPLPPPKRPAKPPVDPRSD